MATIAGGAHGTPRKWVKARGSSGVVTGRSFLVTVELGSTRTDLGEVVFGKGELVASDWRCAQLSWAMRVAVGLMGSLQLASGLAGSLRLAAVERVQ